MSETQTVSALLPVHAGVNADHFALSLESVLNQTRPVDEVVLVEDGPLTSELNVVAASLEHLHPRVRRVRLPVNGGAGVANQAGLEAASGHWIMKVDADDVCLPHRLETELRACLQRGLQVCGSAMLEFDQDPEQPYAIRRSPRTAAGIRRRARFNNPMNHPTTLYRRDLALGVGGYPPMRYMQDYVLFARLIMDGAVVANLDEPLVRFRGGRGMRKRRRGTEILVLEWELQRHLRLCGLVGWVLTVRNIAARVAFRLVPDRVARMLYSRVLSRPVESLLQECP